jgi:CheY-like chemotaxis protein
MAPGRGSTTRADAMCHAQRSGTHPSGSRLDIIHSSRKLLGTMSSSDTSSDSERRILVVDDDDDARAVVKDLLESEGFSVSQARNGQEALDTLSGYPEPALVLLDLNMPVMSGTELLARMKADDRLASVPVLILSGTAPSKAPQGESVVGFLSKPCDMNALVRTVAAHVHRRDGVVAAVPRP